MIDVVKLLEDIQADPLRETSKEESIVLAYHLMKLAELGLDMLQERGTWTAMGELRTALLPYKNLIERNKSKTHTS